MGQARHVHEMTIFQKLDSEIPCSREDLGATDKKAFKNIPVAGERLSLEKSYQLISSFV